MRKAYLIQFVVIACTILAVTGCIHRNQRIQLKKDDDISDRPKRGLDLLVPDKNNDTISDSNENARERTSSEVQDNIDNKPLKNKRNPEQLSKIETEEKINDLKPLNKSLKSKRNPEQLSKIATEGKIDDIKPYVRMKSITDPKELIKKLSDARKSRKDKRNMDDNDPLAIIVGRKLTRPHRSGQKKYTCFCKQADCQGKLCNQALQNQALQQTSLKNKHFPNVKEYSEDEYAEDTSAEEADEPIVSAILNNGFTQLTTPSPTTVDPIKFSIPFANNVNFDQRAMVNNKNPVIKPNYSSFTLHQTSQMKSQPNQPFSVYQYNPYIMPHPGIIYTGMAPIQQNLGATATATVPAPKIATTDYSPSVFGKNFPNIQECINLYGRTVCVISSNAKPSAAPNMETIDLSDDITITGSSEEKENIVSDFQTTPSGIRNVASTSKPFTSRPLYPENHKIMNTNLRNNQMKGNNPFPTTLSNYNSNKFTNIGPAYPNQYKYQNGPTGLPHLIQTAIPKINVQRPINYVNPNYSVNIQNPMYQLHYPNIQGYNLQTVRATTPIYISGKNTIQYLNSMISSNSNSADTSRYISSHSSNQAMKSENYENKFESSERKYAYSNNYQKMPQTKISAPNGYRQYIAKGPAEMKYYENQNVQKETLNGNRASSINNYGPQDSTEIKNNENYNKFYTNSELSQMYSTNSQNLKQNNMHPALPTTPVQHDEFYKNINAQFKKPSSANSDSYVSNNPSIHPNIQLDTSQIAITTTPTYNTVGNPQFITDYPEQEVKSFDNIKTERSKLSEHYPQSNFYYANFHTSKETEKAENFGSKVNILKSSYPHLSSNENIAQNEFNAITGTTPNYEYANSKLNTDKSIEVVEYYKDKNAQQVKLSQSYVGASSHQILNHNSQENINKIDYPTIIEAATPKYNSDDYQGSALPANFHPAVNNYMPNYSPKIINNENNNVQNIGQTAATVSPFYTNIEQINTNLSVDNLKYYENANIEQDKLTGAYPVSSYNDSPYISKENEQSSNYENNNSPLYSASINYQNNPQDNLQRGKTIAAINNNDQNLKSAVNFSNGIESNSENEKININEDDPYQVEGSEHVSAIHSTTPATIYSPTSDAPYSHINNPQEQDVEKFEYNNENQAHVLNAQSGNSNYENMDYLENPVTQGPLQGQVSNLKPEILIQPPTLYNIENLNTRTPFTENLDTLLGQSITETYNDPPIKNNKYSEHIAEPVTTLEDVENDEYKNHFNAQRISTLRAVVDPIQGQTDSKTINSENQSENIAIPQNHTQITERNMVSEAANNIPNDENTSKFVQSVLLENDGTENHSSKKHNDTESLFKDLEQIILNNMSKENMDLSSEKGTIKNNENNKAKLNSGSTESVVQSVDERPLIATESTSEVKSLNTNTEEEMIVSQSKEVVIAISKANNKALLEYAVKKVINNLVPGKAQDLNANYGSRTMPDIVGANIEDLLPEIVSTPILKNLFSLPEVENMITDTASNFLTQVTGLQIIGDIPHLIKDTIHTVIEEIPRPHPTVAPMTVGPMAVEEHQYKDGQWVTDRATIAAESPNVGAAPKAPKEVFDKIKSIINRSEIEEQAAAQPIVENLIIKAVKHSLDKEKGIIDESTIRQAFDILVPSKFQDETKSTMVTRSPPAIDVTEPMNLQAKATTTSDAVGYKIAPIIPVTEHTMRGGLWSETQKNLVGNQPQDSVEFDENKKKLLQEKLDQQMKMAPKVTTEQPENNGFDENKKKILQEKLEQEKKMVGKAQSVACDTENLQKYDSNAANVKEGSGKSKIVVEKSLDYALLSEELENTTDEKVGMKMDSPEVNLNDSIERKPIKYYSPNDRILDYIKNHQSTVSPNLPTTAEIIGFTDEDRVDMATHQVTEKIPTYKPNYNIRQTTEKINSSSKVKQSNLSGEPKNRFTERQSVKNDNSRFKTEATRQVNDRVGLGQSTYLPENSLSEIKQNKYNVASTLASDPSYLGKLIPVDYQKTSQPSNSHDLQDSNLVYVGDGVRLPLAIRKLQDGTFALTLSDEVCNQFVNRKCPCCIPNDDNGVIVRERRDPATISQLNFMDDDSTSDQEFKYENENFKVDLNTYRLRRDSDEASNTYTRPYPTKNSEFNMNNNFNRKNINAGKISTRNRTKGLLDTLAKLVYNRKTDLENDAYMNSDSYEKNENTDRYNAENNNKAQIRRKKLKRKRIKNNYTPWTKIERYNDNIDRNEPSNDKFNYKKNNEIFNKFGQPQYVIHPSTSRPLYQYQRYATEDKTVLNKTEYLKNMLHWMKDLVINTSQHR